MEQGILLHVLVLRLYLSLIENVGIDKRDKSRAHDRHEEEPEGRHATQERAQEGEHARDHEQYRAETMGFVPDPVAGKRPRGPDANKEVPLGSAEHIADEEKQDSHGRQHGFAHAKVREAQVPAQSQRIYVKHKCDDEHDKHIEDIPERDDVGLKRINPGDD